MKILKQSVEIDVFKDIFTLRSCSSIIGSSHSFSEVISLKKSNLRKKKTILSNCLLNQSTTTTTTTTTVTKVFTP